MGHTRLGRLPKTLGWQSVVALIDSSPADVPAVARAVVSASNARLQQLSNDPSLVHCFWLLTRLAAASREDDFAAALQRLELPVPVNGSALGYIAQVNDEVRLDIAGNLESGPFGEIASLALRSVLSETMGHHGRSLFGSSVDDVQHAIRAHSTPGQFGQLARRFFGDYLARTMRFFVEKELSNNVGPGHDLVSIEESQAFAQALDRFTRESARIVEDFAGEWYSKHNWESGGQISRQEVEGFVAVALRKLRSELRQSRP
ncbi:MAG: hypothetical protein H0V47_16795 [Chloroflexia bacterium]|nr:hypothetical protein [Chloroflexia bacterium]